MPEQKARCQALADTPAAVLCLSAAGDTSTGLPVNTAFAVLYLSLPFRILFHTSVSPITDTVELANAALNLNIAMLHSTDF